MKNIDLQSTEGILFLCFYTKYNIQKIHDFLNKYLTIEELITFDTFNPKDMALDDYISKCFEDVKLCVDKAILFDTQMITYFDDNYPKEFKYIKNPPPILFTKGYLHQFNYASVVGTRKTTIYGEKITKRVAKRLVENNYGVVSGLAEGIDTIAHRTALEYGGYTVAILATNMDKIYPTSNYGLAADILKNKGCLISEFPFGINKGKQSFIMRNRLVSALSSCLFPIELSEKSGTMHTVNFAIEQNKELIVLEPNDEYKEKSKQSLSGIISIINRINNNEIINATVIQNEEDLKERLSFNRIYNDRKFEGKTLVVYEKI